MEFAKIRRIAADWKRNYIYRAGFMTEQEITLAKDAESTSGDRAGKSRLRGEAAQCPGACPHAPLKETVSTWGLAQPIPGSPFFAGG